jgi:hypothetical protein
MWDSCRTYAFPILVRYMTFFQCGSNPFLVFLIHFIVTIKNIGILLKRLQSANRFDKVVYLSRRDASPELASTKVSSEFAFCYSPMFPAPALKVWGSNETAKSQFSFQNLVLSSPAISAFASRPTCACVLCSRNSLGKRRKLVN